MKTHLHFTFGPVQSFVAQARRTRDLYAGSFLLSHLALKAMQATPGAGDKVILPDYARLHGLGNQTVHAIAPNRFIAEFANEAAAAEAGRLAGAELQTEWQNIAEVVWTRFLAPVAECGHDTRRIWDRQISNFWEIAWVVGDEAKTDLLDRRKNWRTPPSTSEGGDHCALMGQWQELSGFIRSKQHPAQDAFWQAVRAESDVRKLDLEDDERLCAIAFVKRFFPRVSKDAIGRELDMQSWPSTVSIAAVPWMRLIKDKPEVHAASKAYAELVGNKPGARVSSARRIAALENFSPATGDFVKLSGNFLNRTALENKRGTPLNDDDKDRRELLLEKLRELEKATGDSAGNFYALLLMDGDRMGALIREHTVKAVTRCLTEFASKVAKLIENEKHSGICIYAGGDDLLAMLPLDRALEAVTAVRELYVKSFAGAERKITATISAGLVFAHYRCASSRVLEHAHHLLNTVAKNGADRDALALGVLKPGGVTCQWVGKFNQFIQNGAHCFAPLVAAFGEDCDRRAPQSAQSRVRLSSSFLYNLRERFGELFGSPVSGADSDANASTFDEKTLTNLFVAEYLHGRLDKEPVEAQRQREDAKQLMEQLIQVCQQAAVSSLGGKRLDLDGARLVKFLALDGKEGVE
jgi:CRISPR-associated protein Cmr2